MALVDDLVAYYKLDEASGTAYDWWGASDLSEFGTVGTGTGKLNGARDFTNSSSNTLAILNSTVWEFTADQAFTIALWAKFDSLSDYNVLISRSNTETLTANEQLLFRIYYDSAANRFKGTIGNGSTSTEVTANTLGAPSTGTWYFFCLRHDPVANLLKLSVNGSEDTASWSGGTQGGGTNTYMRLGAQANGEPHDGLIDEVAFWKGRSIDDSEVSSLYNAGSGYAIEEWGTGLDDAAPYAVAHWTLDETSGTRDDSIGSSHLTDHNTVGSAAGKFDNAADFVNASSETLYRASSATLQAGSGKLFILAWCKPDSTALGTMNVVAKRVGVGNLEYYLRFNGTYFNFEVSPDGGVPTANVSATNFGSISAGNWYMVCGWHDPDADIIGVSVNAVPNTTAHSTGIYQGSSHFALGAYFDGAGSLECWDGLIDDVVLIKGYILTQYQQALAYDNGSGVAFADWAGAATASPPPRFVRRPYRFFRRAC